MLILLDLSDAELFMKKASDSHTVLLFIGVPADLLLGICLHHYKAFVYYNLEVEQFLTLELPQTFFTIVVNSQLNIFYCIARMNPKLSH